MSCTTEIRNIFSWITTQIFSDGRWSFLASAAEGVRAMQAINRLIVRPSFLLVFMGTAASSVVSAYVAYGDVGPWRYIGLSAGLYVVGCLLSTILFNVPLND